MPEPHFLIEEQVLNLTQREVEQVREMYEMEAKPVEALTTAAARLEKLGL